jgi:hypothetical protein
LPKTKKDLLERNINNFALEFYRKLSEFGPQHRLLKQISSFNLSRRPIRILDIGSGGAMYWHEVLKKFPGAIALDLLDPAAPESLRTLMAEGEVRHIPAIAPQGLSKIPADSYDIVVAFDLIAVYQSYSLLMDLFGSHLLKIIHSTPTYQVGLLMNFIDLAIVK